MRAVYAAHARAPSLADQRRGGPGGSGGGQGLRGISLIAYEMPFASIFGSESYRCDARHQVDERNEKNSQSRTRSVRVRSVAHSDIEGQRAGFPLLVTRARACGDLPSVRGTSSARPGTKSGGFGWRSFFSYYYYYYTTVTSTYYYKLLLYY